MLQHLQEKKDVGFFTSVSGLMQQCWYERYYDDVDDDDAAGDDYDYDDQWRIKGG